MAAQRTCLEIPEILQAILLHADMRTLLVSAQRVCRRWQTLIAGSPSLQQHLFFRPAPDGGAISLNPLLKDKFPQWFRIEPGSKPFYPEDLKDHDMTHKDGNAAYKHKSATWRTMLPRQPPILSFTRCRIQSARGRTWSQLTLISEGATVEQLEYTSKMGTDIEEQSPSVPAQPLRMESLFRLVTDSFGDIRHWTFVWAGQSVEQLDPLRYYQHKSKPDVQEQLDDALLKDGLFMLELRVKQCTGKGPWQLPKEFILNDSEEYGFDETRMSAWLKDIQG